MSKCCLVELTIPEGNGVTEVCVASLHQLALIMPASVAAYKVIDNGDTFRRAASDDELYEALMAAVDDIRALAQAS